MPQAKHANTTHKKRKPELAQADTNNTDKSLRYRGVKSLSDPLPADILSLNRCYFALGAAANAMMALMNQPRSRDCSDLVDEWWNALLIRKDEAMRAILEKRAASETDLELKWEVIVDHMSIVEPDPEGLIAKCLHFRIDRARLRRAAVHAKKGARRAGNAQKHVVEPRP